VLDAHFLRESESRAKVALDLALSGVDLDPVRDTDATPGVE
jgi:hypothetical protein